MNEFGRALKAAVWVWIAAQVLALGAVVWLGWQLWRLYIDLARMLAF